jgi:hypothetical protein
MSTTDYADVFTPVDESEWQSLGGGAASKGMYVKVLTAFAESGHRTATIGVNGGLFNGKKASAVATSLKAARDGKNAPDAIKGLEISSKGEKDGSPALVFLKNPSVEA